MSNTSSHQFSSLRSFFWPVHRHEAHKLIPMMLILLLICFAYNILRPLKDAIVVTTSGAEAIPFLKVWGILPGALITTLLFTKLSNRFSQEYVFYIITSGFLFCFALFAFVLYPAREALHLDLLADRLQLILPIGAKGFVAMVRHWSFSFFYILAELWGSAVMSVLFWGFANEVMRLHEARRFYGLLGIAANFSALIAGGVGAFCSQGELFNPRLPFGHNGWEQTLMLETMIVIGSGIATMAIFRWMNLSMLAAPTYKQLHSAIKQRPKKCKLSLKESLSFLSRSRYLACIAILVIAYNLTMNLVEVVWKDQLSRLYPSAADYNVYMNHLITVGGIISTPAAFFVSAMINRLGWTATALAMPLVMLVTCTGFFAFLFLQDSLSDSVITFTGITPLAIAVYFGAAQNALSRAAKYTVFDATKEMTFIPLDHETKLKGKAAIDGVGSRFGKSGGALIHQSLLMFFTTLSASVPYVAAILFVIIVVWIAAARLLGKQFSELALKEESNLPSTAPQQDKGREAVLSSQGMACLGSVQ